MQEFYHGCPGTFSLKPIIKAIRDRYNRLDISDDMFADGVILTADTGFASEDNMEFLHTAGINGYIPDNQFRSQYPKFVSQNRTHPKPSRAN